MISLTNIAEVFQNSPYDTFAQPITAAGISILNNCPEGYERTAALEKLREALFYARESVRMNANYSGLGGVRKA